MPQIETLSASCISDVLSAVSQRLRALHEREPLISPHVDDATLAQILLAQRDDVLVAHNDDRFAGHLRATILDSDAFARAAWVGPESLSYDSVETLEALYIAQSERWVERGAREHYVWCAREEVAPWLDLGFSFAHQRGVLELSTSAAPAWPVGYDVRRGSLDDLEIALSLDQVLDDAQRGAPSFLDVHGDPREEWIETLSDPETFYVVVERDASAVAHCVLFPLERRVGSFEATVHLSAVCVRREHRRLGVARAMIDHALAAAASAGYCYVETNWRVSNRRAARYWESYGFQPTFTRLRRAIDGR